MISSVEQRFWSKVKKNQGCWLWTAKVNWKGYGRFWVQPREVAAHRFAYELVVGPIPAGLTIDHLCRTRACVNPAHLEPVTSRENTLRGDTFQARNVRKTHCPQGHPYSEANTRLTKKGGRACRTCERERARLQRAKKRKSVDA